MFGEVTRKMNARDNLNADSTLFVNYFYRIWTEVQDNRVEVPKSLSVKVSAAGSYLNSVVL